MILGNDPSAVLNSHLDSMLAGVITIGNGGIVGIL